MKIISPSAPPAPPASRRSLSTPPPANRSKPSGSPPWESATVDISASQKSLAPRTFHLTIQQFGDALDIVTTKTYSEPATLKTLELHAGGRPPPTSPAPASTRSNSSPSTTSSLLRAAQHAQPGYRLAHARTLRHRHQPPPHSSPNSQAPKLRVGERLTASFHSRRPHTHPPSHPSRLPRPSITASQQEHRWGNRPAPRSIYAGPDDLPVTQQLTFSLKSAAPFPRTGQLEIANADETLRTTLSVASGSLVLQNPHTLLATLDPLKAFGNSAFGPLRLRPVSPDGTTGDWLPLVNLVRLPTFKDLHCPPDTTLPCTISGSSLYLVDSIATDADFTTPTTVPEGFVGTTLSLPRPAKTGFYLRLRDDPTPANSVTLPILPQQVLTDH